MSQFADLRSATMDEVYDLARKQLRKGVASDELITMLVAGGVSQQGAESVIKNLGNTRANKRGTDAVGIKNMVVGGGVCLLGILVTAGSYYLAADGGIYIVAYGSVLCGGGQFF
ncbi:MAG: hypothetical protein HN350_10885 [Phycisphaerales bacterium]|nr:hypothetical protein [Phycisphaerales bacterium]